MKKSKDENSRKRTGVIVTVLFHVFFILLMCFYGFNYKTPPIGDVAIGFDGFGDPDAGNDAGNPEQVNTEKVEESPKETAASNAEEDEIATQDNAPVEVQKNDAENKKEEKKEEERKENENNKEQEQKVEERKVDDDLRKMMENMGKASNDGGSGKGGKEGNQGGDTGDDPGSGSGDQKSGIGMFDFGGRKATKPGDLRHDCNVEGRVKVEVTVNRYGDVTQARVVGGNTANQCLREKAVIAAKNTKYSPNQTGPSKQIGEIELYFQLN